MAWQKLIITTPTELANALADWLMMETPALSVTLEDAKDNPVFAIEVNEQPLWEQVSVCALFETTIDLTPIILALKIQFEDKITYKTEILEDEDWVRKTQQQFQPQCHGKDLWICPTFHDHSILSGSVIRIDPGLAFGTGTHPTTALCLEWLANHPPKGQIVVDYGCGSGILALAALALGAKTVYAIDHDPQAIEATQNNARLNDFVTADNLIISLDSKLPEIKAQTVLANILANPLITLVPTLIKLLDTPGNLVLSGILASEEQLIIAAYQPPIQLMHIEQQQEWLRLDFEKST